MTIKKMYICDVSGEQVASEEEFQSRFWHPQTEEEKSGAEGFVAKLTSDIVINDKKVNVVVYLKSDEIQHISRNAFNALTKSVLNLAEEEETPNNPSEENNAIQDI